MIDFFQQLLNSNYTWPTVVGLVVIFAISLFQGREARKEKLKEEARDAYEEYLNALENDTPEQIILKKKRWLKLKKYLSMVVVLLMLTSCRTTTKYIPIGEYIMTPKAGEIVPDLPEGETRWLLLSAPTGTKLILEGDL